MELTVWKVPNGTYIMEVPYGTYTIVKLHS